jgi:transcriptional regulator with XRE-family HTH domain
MVTTQRAGSLGTLRLILDFDPREVGRRIAAARRRKGWTQLSFAGKANVSPSSVSRWERGKLPPVRELVRVAAVLEIDVMELVEEEPLGSTHGDAAILAELEKIKILLREVLANQEAQDEPVSDRPREDAA